MSGLVRTQKQSEAARGTHTLERADVGTSRNMEAKRDSERNPLAGDRRRQNRSGHGQREATKGTHKLGRAVSGLVRTWKQSKAARGTHDLESVGIGTG